MIISYFSIYDKKAQLYGALFSSPTPGSAERSLRDSVNTPDSLHGKHPGDFALYRILDLDDETGQIVEQYFPPQLVVECTSLTT